MSSLRLLEHAPLVARNTLRVPATAPLLAQVRDRAALEELLGHAGMRGGPLLVLGEGSNLLLAGDPQGLVVQLDLRGIDVLHEGDDGALVRAEAGVGWNDFVHWTLGRRLEGLENLALIPGHVGAAPVQNIGAYGTEVGEFVATVEAFDRSSGQLCRLDHAACGFAYRDSVFKREPERWIVVAVEFRLPRHHTLRTDYAGIGEELAAMGIDRPRAAHVAEAVIRLRTRKLPDPAQIGNAGSFFKNPQVDAALAAALRVQYPQLPVYPAADPAQRKLSAAWMIEACGWKGHREGDAGISAQHSLVLVNHGHATGAQLLELARRVAASVRDRFGVAIEPEPRIIGATW
ncbi:MAG: UDP-N-acetylmuramate dehydrogenase [Proteobacteria bacterium]|nr:UDP-N-acetylmuramate dehydrogenase [Pseudomonadota bacterium]